MKKIKNICCIGAGYVGGPTMSVIALKCPDVTVNVVDLNVDRIAAWNNNDLEKLPIYEPGLADVVRVARGRNLFFSSSVNSAIEDADMIFIAVNTPTKNYGEGKGMAADLKFVELCARQIASVSTGDKIIVEKSTLPVRTAQSIRTILKSNSNNFNFEVLSNPEFLAEGTAINDLLNPDRVLIGGDDTEAGQNAKNSLVEIYSSWLSPQQIITTNLWSAELAKLSANALLAQRVSSINALSAICEVTEADVDEVSKAVGKDSRIGQKFLKASVGFGGSCFQKDVLNLVYLCRHFNLDEVAHYWEQIITLNNYQKTRFAKKIIYSLFGTVNGKKITFLGWAFKKDTNDSRESASIHVAESLIEEGAEIHVYDPKVSEDQIRSDMRLMWESRGVEEKAVIKKSTQIFVHNEYTNAVLDSYAIALLTEWDEFLSFNWQDIYKNMHKPAFLFDGRGILDVQELKEIGFETYTIGK